MSRIRFGTDGWRGILAADFTFAGVRAVAGAIARFLDEHEAGKPVLIGYDNRFLAYEMALTAQERLAEYGIGAWVTAEPCPTPVLAHAVRQRQAGGAIMFTASHNPPPYQGMKFIPSYAGPATPEITNWIEAEANALLAAGAAGSPPTAVLASHGQAKCHKDPFIFDPAPEYWAALERLVDFDAIRHASLNVAVDPMYGVGSRYLARLATDPGLLLHGGRDPLFGGLTPEPTQQRLGELASLVRDHGCHLGLATDGDADRFGVIDSEAGYLTPNQVLLLLFWYLAERRGMPGGVARTVATTHALDRIADALGRPVHATPVGFKWVGEVMRREPICIGGEESGGLSVLGHIPEKDGILANLLLLEMRAVLGCSLGQALRRIEAEYGPTFTRRIDVALAPGDRTCIEARLVAGTPATLGGLDVIGVDRLDGFRFQLEEGAWTLVRFSGTEPLMRIYGEAGSAAQLQAILDDIVQILIPSASREGFR